MTDRSIRQRLAAALSPPPHGYDAQTAPPALRPIYNTLSASPADYGTLLPFARNRVGSASWVQEGANTRLALPSAVREGLFGTTDLLAGLDTGQVTPRAAETLALGGTGAGGFLAPRGALAVGGAPLRAYHASPYNYDKVDMSKVGTGEGAQAFGHGFYSAQSEPVMEGYYRKFLNHPGVPTGKTPTRYELALHTDPQKMLDLDKGLVHQREIWDRIDPKIRATIDDALENRGMNPMSGSLEDYNGKHLYQSLKHHEVHDSLPPVIGGSSWYTGATTEEKHTSAFLNSLGVSGVKYLDALSRKAGDGTRNYVSFDPATIEILRKYGMAVPAPVAVPSSEEIDTRPRAVLSRIMDELAVR